MSELSSYGLLIASTVMFGFMFFFNDMFLKNYKDGLQATLLMSFGSGIFGLIVLLMINGWQWEFTLFAFLMAILTSANNLLFSFCSLKALGKINLSLYSLFSMLGGMTLPFLSGILFYGESLTVGKLACFGIVTVSLCLTVKKDRNTSGGLYYAGIFVFNGMSGVLSQIYQEAPFVKASSAGYSVLCSVVSVALCGVFLLMIKEKTKKITWPCLVAMAGQGILGRVANFLLLVALLSLPASAQYPFVTGGTIIVSTIISFFGKNKPTPREIVAVLLAFIGVTVLVLLPADEIIKITWRQ